MKLRHWRWCLGLALAGLAAYWGYHFRLDHRYDWTIRGAAQRYGVDPALVKAVVWKESRFKPTARGTAGEIGLMQLRELAAVEWSSAENLTGFEMDHLLDPRTNILAGTWYLAHLLRRYRGTDDPVPFALADYNAGRTNVRRWFREDPAGATNSVLFIAKIGFPTTRRYVESILRKRDEYRGDFPAFSLASSVR